MNIELYVFRVREINVDIKSRKILIVITRALFFIWLLFSLRMKYMLYTSRQHRFKGNR